MNWFWTVLAVLGCIWGVMTVIFFGYIYLLEARVLKKLEQLLDEDDE